LLQSQVSNSLQISSLLESLTRLKATSLAAARTLWSSDQTEILANSCNYVLES